MGSFFCLNISVMKRNIFFVIFFLSFLVSNAQEEFIRNGVEKNIAGIQAGFFGVDVYNEFKLSKIMSLRADFSLYGGIFYDDSGANLEPFNSEGSNITLTPIINLQHKVYYNIIGRAKRGKNIKNNGSNYFSFNVKYVPNWFVISKKDITPVTQLYFVPTFGIRRSFEDKFNYEFKAGLGGGVAYIKDRDLGVFFLELSFKIGYDFFISKY